MSDNYGKWQRELAVFSKMSSSIILTGNIYDVVPTYGDRKLTRVSSLEQYLCDFMVAAGYQYVLQYDMVQGFWDMNRSVGANSGLAELQEQLRLAAQSRQRLCGGGGGQQGANGPSFSLSDVNGKQLLLPESLEDAASMIQLMMSNSRAPIGIIVRFSSQFVARPNDLDLDERRLYLFLRTACEQAKKYRVGDNQQRVIQNQLYLLTAKLNDLPAWFTMSFPQMKVINIERPNYRDREVFIQNMASFFTDYAQAGQESRKLFLDQFVGRTEGLTYLDLNNIRMLAASNRVSIRNVDRVILLYRHGIYENPWTQLEGAEMSSLETEIKKRVKGQDPVVRQTVDILKRAIVGMSGLQHSDSSAKPRGILFFAGPTGTGKTELAKAITQCIFKDERNMIRFDMSEYGQSQSDQRLLGAPPGYVGYEEGGQLTNAVREHPFSVLLFDEIEKAHPSILDKFLQILDDGRITDGRGDTVYFQDCLIIFTSNLGITRPSERDPRHREVVLQYDPNVSYHTVCEKVLEGVRAYFEEELGRPELLNRIGNNILVFDFIREESLVPILKKQLDSIKFRLSEDKQITLDTDMVFEKLVAFAKEQLPLGQGGRGVGNVVEQKLINPLARYIFDNQVKAGAVLTLTDITEDDTGMPMIQATMR